MILDPKKAPPLDRIDVILVEPKSPGNVGSVARVCRNAGLGALAIAGPVAWGDGPAFREEAVRMARHAAPLVDSMARHADLGSAVASYTFVVGTSVRPTGAQRLATPRTSAAEILERAELGRVALVFGREDRGLATDELLHCDLKLTIPSSPAYAAWNISHAVAIIAATLFEEAHGAPRPRRPFPSADLAPADHAEHERLYAALGELLLSVGYLDPANPERMMADLRRILSGLQSRDVRILLGVVHQLAWACGRARPAGDGSQ